MIEFRLLVGIGRSGLMIGRICLIWSLNSLTVPSYDKTSEKITNSIETSAVNVPKLLASGRLNWLLFT